MRKGGSAEWEGPGMADGQPSGVIGLADAIEALRSELIRAWRDSRDEALRFRLAPVELTVQAAVTKTGEGSAGVKWWLLELGGRVSKETGVTQTIKLVLDPTGFDPSGHPMDITVSDADQTAQPRIREHRLDDGD